jgi:hypothetical protein
MSAPLFTLRAKLMVPVVVPPAAAITRVIKPEHVATITAATGVAPMLLVAPLSSGVPESMRTLQLAVATSRTAQVSFEKALDAALTAETLTFWDAPCREQGCLSREFVIVPVVWM